MIEFTGSGKIQQVREKLEIKDKSGNFVKNLKKSGYFSPKNHKINILRFISLNDH